MNRVSRRAWVLLVVAGLIAAALLAFFVKYFIKAEDWVSFPGSPHLYTGVNPNTGIVTDRSGVQLLDSTGDRTYSEDLILRESTLHLLGDRYGYIEAPVLGHYSDKLVGYNVITGLFHTKDELRTAELSLSAKAQAAAYSALAGRKGTVGVYNYRTGEILCAVTSPSYDPDNVPDIEHDETGTYDGVYVNRFFGATYTPGSIFKVLTTAAALEQVPGILDETFTCEGETVLEGERITCTGVHGTQTLGEALTNSCNIAFAQITCEVGREQMEAYAEKAGIRTRLDVDGVRTAAGNLDLSEASTPSLAWSGIGQYTDLINPCQYLVFLGSIANGGSAALPHLMQEIRAGDAVKYEASSETFDSGIEAATAAKVADMMHDNVVNSYGTGLFPDVRVCAKSGTAEIREGAAPNAMFAGFVQDDRYPLAFIVVVEEGGYGSQTAAPIAGQVLSACIEDLNGTN